MIHGHHSRKFYVFIACVVFAAVMGGTLVYTFSQQKLYASTARLQFFPQQTNPDVRDFNEMISIVESATIVRGVANDLINPSRAETSSLNLESFLAAYRLPKDTDISEIEKLLQANRKVIPHHDTYTIDLQYRHPDRLMAAKIANLFANEYIAHSARKRIDEAMRLVIALKSQAEAQELKVKALEQAMSAYRKAHPELTPETLESDPAYHALSLQFTAEDRVLKDLIERIRNTTML